MVRMRGRAPDPIRANSPDEKGVEAAAMRLLARREHSTEELRRKLTSRGYDAALVAAVLGKLSGKRLLSDDRFAASLVRHHVGQGKGPLRIRVDLRQQGISDSLIEEEFGNVEVDWNRLAAQVRQRKFGAAQPRNLSERAKQARFLQYRGFSTDQIRAAFGGGDERFGMSDEGSDE